MNPSDFKFRSSNDDAALDSSSHEAGNTLLLLLLAACLREWATELENLVNAWSSVWNIKSNIPNITRLDGNFSDFLTGCIPSCRYSDGSIGWAKTVNHSRWDPGPPDDKTSTADVRNRFIELARPERNGEPSILLSVSDLKAAVAFLCQPGEQMYWATSNSSMTYGTFVRAESSGTYTSEHYQYEYNKEGERVSETTIPQDTTSIPSGSTDGAVGTEIQLSSERRTRTDHPEKTIENDDGSYTVTTAYYTEAISESTTTYDGITFTFERPIPSAYTLAEAGTLLSDCRVRIAFYPYVSIGEARTHPPISSSTPTYIEQDVSPSYDSQNHKLTFTVSNVASLVQPSCATVMASFGDTTYKYKGGLIGSAELSCKLNPRQRMLT